MQLGYSRVGNRRPLLLRFRLNRRIVKFHATRIRQAIQESADGDTEGGVDRIRGELAQRNEDKAPPVQFRVGNDQIPLANDLLTVEEDDPDR